MFYLKSHKCSSGDNIIFKHLTKLKFRHCFKVNLVTCKILKNISDTSLKQNFPLDR